MGRSYGDCCLNHQGVLVDTTRLDRFIAFDRENGLLECEAGVTLGGILQLIEPLGWFLPVTPGTRFVTVAGAIANDVHGKNHHRRGCFSHHLENFELCRSDGRRIVCSESENPDWFRATVGGLGLTGIISKATLRLMRVESPCVEVESVKMKTLGEFFELCAASSTEYEYTVAWIDCLAQGKQLGRGIFSRANHAKPRNGKTLRQNKTALAIPLTLPVSVFNRWSLRLFNTLYYHRQRNTSVVSSQARNAFFYPLDGVLHWNRLYGRRGFLQYQCMIPMKNAEPVVAELLGRIAKSGKGSFLVVLKTLGDIPARGMLSFAGHGVTLAMDFPYQGADTLSLLDSLDDITAQAGGRVYPAKDARMQGVHFKSFYPQWKKFLDYKDPALSSSFWRRVMEES